MSLYVQLKFWSVKILSLCGTIGLKLDGVEFSPKKIEWRQWYHVTCSKFLNVHHVVVKVFQGSQFLRCDCYLYERWVNWFTWIHLCHEFIYIWIHIHMYSYIQWIHVYQEFINSMNSSNRHVFRKANICCINNQMRISMFTCPKGNQWITAECDKNSALENFRCTLQQWFIRNRYGIEENPIDILTLWGHGSTYISGLII